MDSIEQRLTTLEVEIRNLKENVDNTRGELKSDINNLKVDLNKGFDYINTCLPPLTDRVTRVEERIGTRNTVVTATALALPSLVLLAGKLFGVL